MKRKIVNIDSEKCNGCGACAAACHEGAIEMINGKAKLISDHYCDGLGDCLPACPTDAITIIEREADAYDEEAVKKRQEDMKKPATLECGCPGTHVKKLERLSKLQPKSEKSFDGDIQSRLSQWPVQIKLVPANAPYFDNANLLIAADCTAYAFGNFHEEFIKNRITLIGCPKLDFEDYANKLTQIIAQNNIKSVTVVRMEVPCCKGIENSVITALRQSGKMIPWQVKVISTSGDIVD